MFFKFQQYKVILTFSYTQSFFYNNEVLPKSDLVRYTQSLVNLSASGTTFHTLITSLSFHENEIISLFSKTLKYDIRIAIKYDFLLCFENLSIRNEDSINEFILFYNNFAKSKNLSLINHNYFSNLFKFNSNIYLTKIYKSSLDTLCYHLLIGDGERVRLLLSSSSLSNSILIKEIGFANKLLHYKELLFFKSQNYFIYDWGGVSKNNELAGIDFFKKQFGGQIEVNYNFYLSNTFLGYLYLKLFL